MHFEVDDLDALRLDEGLGLRERGLPTFAVLPSREVAPSEVVLGRANGRVCHDASTKAPAKTRAARWPLASLLLSLISLSALLGRGIRLLPVRQITLEECDGK